MIPFNIKLKTFAEPLWKFLSSRGEVHHGKICPVILSADKEYTFVVRKEPAM